MHLTLKLVSLFLDLTLKVWVVLVPVYAALHTDTGLGNSVTNDEDPHSVLVSAVVESTDDVVIKDSLVILSSVDTEEGIVVVLISISVILSLSVTLSVVMSFTIALGSLDCPSSVDVHCLVSRVLIEVVPNVVEMLGNIDIESSLVTVSLVCPIGVDGVLTTLAEDDDVAGNVWEDSSLVIVFDIDGVTSPDELCSVCRRV